MSHPYTFDSSLRRHDEAVLNWVRTCRVDYGTCGGLFATAMDNQPILSVFGPVDEAQGQLLDHVLKTGWLTPGVDATDLRTRIGKREQLITPFAVVEAALPQPAVEGRQVAGILRGPEDDIDPRTGKRAIYPFPAQYSTDYTVTFTTAKRFTRNFIVEWAAGEFGNIGNRDNERLLTVSHPAPFGDTEQSFKLLAMLDQTDPTASPLVYKFQYTFTLRTHILRGPVTSWGGIEPAN